MSADYYKTLIKDIIENNEKEKAIEIIANKLNEKQISNEKEMLTNLDKDKEIERLKDENKILKESLGIKSPSKEMLEGKYWETKEIERLKNGCKELEQQIDDLLQILNKGE